MVEILWIIEYVIIIRIIIININQMINLNNSLINYNINYYY